MARPSLALTEVWEERRILLPSRPLTSDEFVALFGEDGAVELVEWFIDLTKKRVRILWKRDGNYEVRTMRKGVLRSRVVDGFWLRVEWLLQKPLPSAWETVQRLLGSPPSPR